MGICRNKRIYQTLEIYQEMVSIKQTEEMNEEGFDLWWKRISYQICRNLIKKLTCQNQDVHDERMKNFSFFVEVIIPPAMEEFLNSQEDKDQYLFDKLEKLLKSKIQNIEETEIFFADPKRVFIFLDLEHKSKEIILNYDDADIELSGNERYPKKQEYENQGGCLYKKDLTPNMPYSNCRQCHWGVYWRRLK